MLNFRSVFQSVESHVPACRKCRRSFSNRAGKNEKRSTGRQAVSWEIEIVGEGDLL